MSPAARPRIGSAHRVLECLDFEVEVFTNLVTGRLRDDPGYRAIQAIPGVGQILAGLHPACPSCGAATDRFSPETVLLSKVDQA